MKSNFGVFLVFSLLLVGANVSCGRKDMGEYWKDVMKGQAMPEAIKNLLLDSGNKHLFLRDFNVQPNVILYHSHAVPMKNHKKHNPSHVKNQD
ncbi:hypothetical protein RJT34_08264 [Clitoria ternatea]|uniref:Uncharacterized protein n=1 Tax=Clitoria ternatea TaxID=43366 RepID=A0AAN9K6U4_CLITE